MHIGRFTIEQLSEGLFESFADGTFQKLPSEINKPKPREYSFIDRPASNLVGIDPILVKNEENLVLLDTGLGWGLDQGSRHEKASNLQNNLDIFGFRAEDVTHVILTHLHYDHAAGATYVGPDMKTHPTLPNAVYHLQRREWDYALKMNGEKSGPDEAGYNLDEFYRLVADGRVDFIDEDHANIIPGIETIWTGGHTPGHQVVRVADPDLKKSVFYMGDLVPNDSHLNRYAMRDLDFDPKQARQMKMLLLREAYHENAFLLFYHSAYTKFGKLSKDRHRKYILQS